MTPTLDRFFRQWTLYKRCLIAYFAINVFSVVAALVLGINFFVFKKDIGQKQNESFARIEAIDGALSELNDFQFKLQSQKDRGSLTIKTREDELAIVARLENWHKLKSHLSELSDLKLNSAISALVWSNETQVELDRVRAELAQFKTKEWQDSRVRFAKYNDTARLMILTGLLTLFFGVVLPALVMYLMGRALNAIRIEIQNTAMSIVKTWSETQAGFGDGAFKNVEFWLQILLLVGSHSNKISSHPAIQITSELAHLVRLELLKKQNTQDAA